LRDQPFPFTRAAATLHRVSLVADLRLRFGGVRVPARVYLPSPWAAPAGTAPLVLWLAARTAGEPLGRELGAAASAVVLELGRTDAAGDCNGELAALDWAAEHAREFGARPEQLVLAGHRAGGARAALLAVRARDSGWPVVRRQVLVRPAFGSTGDAPSDVAGLAPATIVTTGARSDDGRRYAAALRGAGVQVQELVSGARRALPLDELAGALR
jgi:acetyl esterase/lipase